MADLDQEISFYDSLRADLEARQMGRWVLVHDRKLEGLFATFEEAATAAVERFGGGPSLIRQVGAPPVPLPASVM